MDGDEDRGGGCQGGQSEIAKLRRAVDHHDIVIGGTSFSASEMRVKNSRPSVEDLPDAASGVSYSYS